MPLFDVPSTSPTLPSLRDRLKGLMAFRVAAVTFLLGGMIAAGIAEGNDFSSTRHLALLSLIVVTYGLTIAYALLLEQRDDLHQLAYLQLTGDVATTSLLVLLTYGLDSVFVFLFYINIISAAIVVGRRSAIIMAAIVSAFMIGLGLATVGGLSHPIFQVHQEAPSARPLYFEVAVNCAAAFMVAFLAGDLSDRLGRTRLELEQRRLDLATLRNLTRNIVASLDSGLLTIDREGEIIFFNRAAATMTGLEPSSVVGQPLEDIFPGMAEVLVREQQSEPQAASVLEIGNLSNDRFECEWTSPDGETMFLGFSLSELRDGTDTPIGEIVVFQDLTEIKRLEAEKKRSERMAAIGELAASIAHEIRNPLASISGSVEMLQDVAQLDDSASNLMDIVLREVDRLDMLISEFLDYSRPSNLSSERVDLDELVEEVLELFEEGEQRDLELDLHTDGTPMTLEVDREAIRQILWNLLNNALEAVPDDRTPRIRLELESLQENDRSLYRLSVEDNGSGVDPDEAERIFEPFFTTRDEGSGLGLATTHRLVEAHGGRIQLEEPDRLEGARLTLFFPESADADDLELLSPAEDASSREVTNSASDAHRAHSATHQEADP